MSNLSKFTKEMLKSYAANSRNDMTSLESQLAATLLKERAECDRLQSSINAAYGLLSSLRNQVTPSLVSIRDATDILRSNFRPL